MEMKRINAGKLRAIGYDGSAIDYDGVGQDVWRRLSTSGAAWSFYRDNIEEEFTSRRGRAQPQTSSASSRAALDDLFKPPSES